MKLRHAQRQARPTLSYVVDGLQVWQVFSGESPAESVVFRGWDEESANVVAEALRELECRRGRILEEHRRAVAMTRRN